MPDFFVTIQGSTDRPAWTDPASENPIAPSRLNPDPVHPHTYQRILVTLPSAQVSIQMVATVGGVSGPVDAALGGRLFTGVWAEWSGTAGPPIIFPAPNQSSVMTLIFDGTHLGHQTFRMTRKNGGLFLVHLDVESGL